MQLKLHKSTMAIGYSAYSQRMCARHVDSTNPGRSNLVLRSKPIPEAEMSNRLISYLSLQHRRLDVQHLALLKLQTAPLILDSSTCPQSILPILVLVQHDSL